MKLTSTGGATVEVKCPQRAAGKVLLRHEAAADRGAFRALVQDELTPDEARRVAAWLYAAAGVAEGNQSPVTDAMVRQYIEPALERAGWSTSELARLLRTRFGVEHVWQLPRSRAAELVKIATEAAGQREGGDSRQKRSTTLTGTESAQVVR